MKTYKHKTENLYVSVDDNSIPVKAWTKDMEGNTVLLSDSQLHMIVFVGNFDLSEWGT